MSRRAKRRQDDASYLSDSYTPGYRGTANQATHTSFSRRARRQSSLPPSPELCRYWSIHGHCRLYPNCRFHHDIRLVTRVSKAHSRGIYDVFSASSIAADEANFPPDCLPHQRVVIIFTSSQDKTVKKWILYSPEAQDPQPYKLKVHLSHTLYLEAPCLTLYYSHRLLVCGLNNGKIKIFESGVDEKMTLIGHESEVHCIRLIDNLLVSGDWKGNLKFWKPDPITQTFVDTYTIQIGSPITCFVEVHQGTSRQLWIGCTSSIQILDLVRMNLVQSIRLTGSTPKPPVVMSLLLVADHVICCLLEGVMKVFNAQTGLEILSPELSSSASTKPAHFCSMTGSMSDEGPVLLCGKEFGIVSVHSLPSLKERFFFRHHENDIRAIHNIGEHPSYFITTAFDGSMCVWYWIKPKIPS